jgi:hypothetical protein
VTCTHAAPQVASQSVFRRRLLPSALALLVSLAVQAAHGAPVRSVAEVRAVRCCTDVCHRGAGKTAARQCCRVGQDDPGVLGTSPATAAPALAALPATVLTYAGTARDGTAAAAAAGGVRGRAAPLFLLERSLRL